MRVVKNTLARKALAGTAFECHRAALKGPLVLAFSKDDPGAAARVVKDFAKGNEKLVRDARVARRPGAAGQGHRAAWRVCRPGNRLCRKLLGVMKAPIEKLVRTLAAAPPKLVRTIDAVATRTGRGGLSFTIVLKPF